MRRKLAEFLNVFFGLRKFLAWFGLFLVGIIFRLKGQIDGGQFVDLMKATFSGLVAGNAIEHVVSFGKDYMASKTTPAQGVSAPAEEEVEPVVEN